MIADQGGEGHHDMAYLQAAQLRTATRWVFTNCGINNCPRPKYKVQSDRLLYTVVIMYTVLGTVAVICQISSSADSNRESW